MPVYEFRCGSCRRKTTALVMIRDRVDEVMCRHCGSTDLVNLVSRFATPRSEEARLDQLSDDPTRMSGIDDDDPASVARWMQKMGSEMGDDLGEDFEHALEEEMAGRVGDEAESGDDPQCINGRRRSPVAVRHTRAR